MPAKTIVERTRPERQQVQRESSPRRPVESTPRNIKFEAPSPLQLKQSPRRLASSIREESIPAASPMPEDRLIDKFTALDFNDMMLNAEGILNTRYRWLQEAFEEWAKAMPPQTAHDWSQFWMTTIQPVYLEQENNLKREKIYQKAWQAWIMQNPQGSAEAWHNFYEQTVKPRFEFEDENSQDIPTPIKREPTFPRYSEEPPESTRTSAIQSISKADLPSRTRLEFTPDRAIESSPSAGRKNRTKRSQPFDMNEDEEDLYESPRSAKKRTRREETEIIHIVVNSDELDEEVEEEDIANSSKAQANQVEVSYDDDEEALPRSSPPINPAIHNRQRDAPETQATANVETQFYDAQESMSEISHDGMQRDGDDNSSEEAFETAPDHLDSRPREDQRGGRPASQSHTIQLIDGDEEAEEGLFVSDSENARDGHRQNRNFETAPDHMGYDENEDEDDYNDLDTIPSLEERVASIGIHKLMKEGNSHGDILKAIKMTSAHPTLFDDVLDALSFGEDIPLGPGIWTEAEDAALEGGSARALKRLIEKHGWGGLSGCEGRRDFLRHWRQ